MKYKVYNKEHMHIIHTAETASTNQDLTRLCDERGSEIEELTTLCADYQTAGKGQRGNSWESERGKNLLFSTVLYPTFLEAKRQFLLSQVISLAIKEELDGYTDGISIKWPNDIYWREKKLCGILIENDLAGRHLGRSIVGIGLNINQERFVSDAPNPVSLKQITGRESDCDAVLQGLLERLRSYYEAMKRACLTPPGIPGNGDAFAIETAQRYARSLFRREGLHPYRDAQGRFNARLVRVEADGRFVLEDEQGKERSYLFKEVQYLLE